VYLSLRWLLLVGSFATSGDADGEPVVGWYLRGEPRRSQNSIALFVCQATTVGTTRRPQKDPPAPHADHEPLLEDLPAASNAAASETSTMEWVPAPEAVVDGCLMPDSSTTTTTCLSTCEMILEIQCQALPDKKNWSHGLCQQLRPDKQVVQFRVR